MWTHVYNIVLRYLSWERPRVLGGFQATIYRGGAYYPNFMHSSARLYDSQVLASHGIIGYDRHSMIFI